MLEQIKSPDTLKSLSSDELTLLCSEIRDRILDTVSKNGGHLASNLGAVELEVALHTVFDCPRDKIIYDVGHQCYAHKLLTGRADRFDSLRQYGGLSGFANRDESEYDTLTAGHSGSSLSAALGIASGAAMSGSDAYTIAVIGDGSFTNGMIYEALNNCASAPRRLIIVLNDNGMSISQNVGGLSEYFSRIRTSERYFSFKQFMKDYCIRIPVLGKSLVRISRSVKNAVKRLLLSDNLFESLGLEYLGPVDGNNLQKVISVLREAKNRQECTIVHIKTVKGLGYEPSEKFPEKFHSASPFANSEDAEAPAPQTETFTSTLSDSVCAAAQKFDDVCAVCAAMPDGCGLSDFSKLYPDRFFDVGIAEEHAAAFCGGLSVAGYRPVLVMYSTFSQRVYDQIFHDVALQSASVTFLISHAGLVAGDGITHQGIFDVALFSAVPHVTIYAPDNYREMSRLIETSIEHGGINIIRYPKGSERRYDRDAFTLRGSIYASIPDRADAVIVTYGRITEEAVAAAKLSSYRVGVIRAERLCPLPTDDIIAAIADISCIYILEEGIRSGGFGERLAAELFRRGSASRVHIHAIEDGFIPHGNTEELFKLCSFEPDTISRRLDDFIRESKSSNNMPTADHMIP